MLCRRVSSVSNGQSTGDGKKRKRVLVVDDSFTVREVERKLLGNRGYDVEVAVDGMDGWNVVRSGQFDLVVTDFNMPGLSGLDVARELAEIRPALPVVMTSGYVRTTDRDLAIQNGVRELVLKPDTAQALGEILHRLLDKPIAS